MSVRALYAPLPITQARIGALDIACFVLCAISIFIYPVNHDVAGLLSLADRTRAGARLYVDIIEINPPLIVWLNMPVSAAADLLGIQPAGLYRWLVLALALSSVVATVRIATTRLAAAPMFIAVIGAAGYDFGQREHLALILALPYLAVALRRYEGVQTSLWLKLAVALVAAVGFSIKPHFLLVPMAVEAQLAWSRRKLPDVSCYAIGAVAFLYFVAVLLLTPEYLNVARMLADIYAINYLDTSPFVFLIQLNFYVGLLGVLLVLKTRPRGSAVLMAAAIGFGIAALVQAKGWSYQWYPFAALGWMLSGLAFSALSPGKLRITACLFSAMGVALASQNAPTKNPYLPVLTPVVYELGGGSTAILSSTARVSYPLLSLPGLSNPLRLGGAQLLFASIIAGKPEHEAVLRQFLVDDMVTGAPDLLIAEEHPRGLPAGFDVIQYLSREPAFARAMEEYSLVRTIDHFRVYQRQPARAPVSAIRPGG